MKVVVMTVAQQTQAAALKAELAAAQSVQQAARVAYRAFLNSVVDDTNTKTQLMQCISVTDDGTTLVIN